MVNLESKRLKFFIFTCFKSRMSLFVKYLAPLVRELPQVSLSRRVELEIQNHCMKLLNVKNMGELRDRYEGQKFLDNAISKVSSFLSCCNLLKLDNPAIEVILKMEKTNIEIDQATYNIIVFEFGELPQIESSEYPSILVLKKDKLNCSICGVASTDILKSDKNYSVEKGKRFFTGFENLIELKEVKI